MIHDHRAEGNEQESPADFRSIPSGISEKIRKWAAQNGWCETGVNTNQLRLQRAFGEIIETVARDLKYRHQYLHRHQLYNCWDHLMGLCRQIDMVCRAGCQTVEEVTELEFLRSKAVGIAVELSEVIGFIQNEQPPCFQPLAPNGKVDEWITFAQAAEILAVSKGTVSKWAKAGRLDDNGLQKYKRRLLKTSVLLVKQEIEDEELKEDIKDLKQDARQIS